MGIRYAFQAKGYDKDKLAYAYGRSLPISTRFALEVCREIKNKKLDKAMAILNNAIKLKKPIRFKRIKEGAGHKPGMERGKFVVKTCKYIKQVLESAKHNAINKGLFEESLYIVHACAHIAHRPIKPGRHRGRITKRTHIEIVLAEKEEKTSKDKKTKKKAKVTKEETENADKDKEKEESKKEIKKENIKEKKQETEIRNNK